MNNNRRKIIVYCEDDCLACIADHIFGKCSGNAQGVWMKVIKNVERGLSNIGFIDNDNQGDQIKKLKNYGYKEVYKGGNFIIFEKENKIIVVFDDCCETFLSLNGKIKDKFFKLSNREQKYRVNLLKLTLKKYLTINN